MQNTGTYTLEALVNYVENGTLHMTPGPTEVNATCQCRDYPPAEEAQISIDDLMRESLQDIEIAVQLMWPAPIEDHTRTLVKPPYRELFFKCKEVKITSSLHGNSEPTLYQFVLYERLNTDTNDTENTDPEIVPMIIGDKCTTVRNAMRSIIQTVDILSKIGHHPWSSNTPIVVQFLFPDMCPACWQDRVANEGPQTMEDVALVRIFTERVQLPPGQVDNQSGYTRGGPGEVNQVSLASGSRGPATGGSSMAEEREALHRRIQAERRRASIRRQLARLTNLLPKFARIEH